jgi:hypothetical protein
VQKSGWGVRTGRTELAGIKYEGKYYDGCSVCDLLLGWLAGLHLNGSVGIVAVQTRNEFFEPA